MNKKDFSALLKNTKGFLLDFDGVIVNSYKTGINFFYNYLKKFIPTIEVNFITDYYRITNGFSNLRRIELLFESFGIIQHSEDVFQEFKRYQNTKRHYKGIAITINTGFSQFKEICNLKGLELKIFSANSPEQLSQFNEINDISIYDIKNKSKIDFKTYKELIKDTGINPGKWIHIDDDPLILSISKLSGFNTVLMRNNIFLKKYITSYIHFIDWNIKSFCQLSKKITFLNNKGG